jgi:hypothetical protein
VNFVAETVYHTMSTSTDRPTGTWLNLTSLLPDAKTSPGGTMGPPYQLTAALDTLMLHGAMSPNLQATVNNALASMTGATAMTLVQRAVYLVGSSPEYFVQR